MPGGDSLSQVSVIIPTYNRSQLLRLTVESVLAQTYPNIEIVVVDDGSTDDTAAVMAQYTHRVTYIKQAVNQGGAAAGRNAGFQAASGEYVNFLDHDDLMMPTKIERQVQVLDSRPEVGLVHCSYYHIDADGKPLNRVGLLLEGDVLRDLICSCFLWSGAPLIRRQCLEQVGLFDEHIYPADWDMWLRIARAGYPFACIQEPLGAYRILPDSMMANVDRLEHGVFAVLDKVFADPQLPADVVEMKDHAYGMMRRWMSFRCYAVGRWDDARRNLAEALALCPQMLERPEDILQALYGHALSPHVGDPVRFTIGVFDHLPSSADGLHRYRSKTIGQVYVGLALRNYGLGDIARARDQLTEAVALEPAMLEQMEGFTELLTNHAMRLPVGEPLAYVDTVLQNLPAEAQQLGRVRWRVLGDVNVGCAFEDFAADRRRSVVRHVLTALRYRPSWLANRGVASIFLRSLPGLLTGERSLSQSGRALAKNRGGDGK